MAKKKKTGKKRKPSAYNRHVGAEIKRGKTFKQAVKSWKGGSKKKGTAKRKAAPKKKKTTGGRSVANNSNNNKKMTPSNVGKYYALGGSAITHTIALANDPRSSEAQVNGVIGTYTGYRPIQNKFVPEELIRGYGGAVNDMGWRKLAKAAGIKAYPSPNPKNMSQYLDYATMYGDSIVQAWANKDNTAEAHRRVYEGQYGVDLHSYGWSAYQPAEMLRTKGPYFLKKMVFKLLRSVGYAI